MIPIASPVIGDEEKAAVMRVLESGNLAQGSAVEAFETAFVERFDVRHAISVGSGSAALLVALLAHGIGEGDEVITTPFLLHRVGERSPVRRRPAPVRGRSG